jgi:hypothetical protein
MVEQRVVSTGAIQGPALRAQSLPLTKTELKGQLEEMRGCCPVLLMIRRAAAAVSGAYG